ncbi:acetyl-CoA carboxylase biotin carboxyl carrier protein [Alkalibacterium kapii]|uniref:Biotin carboxyl carrier protein of acetyl-CoA carboxylase n=1 Tax=Alkalibacterium kapii TaxID=426704 RepID=A0A511AT92_9LACT|nr:acetyl-CoA carboxylase biotin carboxyl carrier protein [Alkalibacterium kapii]GEK90932.1 acetyl-CoA carboxylase, biotin carboxyl carrier protein [Alkalibacterium kapii]
MKNEEIKELIQLIDQSSLTHFEFQNASASLKLSKRDADSTNQTLDSVQASEQVSTLKQESKAKQTEKTEMEVDSVEVENAEDESFHLIKSPIVGTSYLSSSPDSEPFVKAGDTVEEGQTVLIIEAMKVMNEIKSDIKGTVEEISVEDGQAIEFDQTLIKIKAT